MTRRSFLAAGSMALAASCSIRAAKAADCSPSCGKVRFRLGMAGYTYHKFKLDETLEALERVGIHYLCVKDFHLPLTATAEEIAAFRAKCADHGVTPYGVGPIYMQTEDEAKRAFDYASALGVPVVVGVPWKPAPDGGTAWKKRFQSPELCAKVSGLCAKYDLKFAIHNHGRNPATGAPTLFGAPADAWGVVKGMDRRMGLCMDIAYAFADGFDPAAEIRKYASRLFDCHFRNISDPTNGSSGTNSADGKIDYYSVVKALADVGYEGVCGIELANAFPKNPEWIPASVGYFRGLMDAVSHATRN